MILSDLLDLPVQDPTGRRLGFCIDARLVLDAPAGAGPLAGARLHGLVVSPRTRTSFMGYERSGVRRPWPLGALLERRHAGTFLVLWEDVVGVERERILVAGNAVRYDARLRG